MAPKVKSLAYLPKGITEKEIIAALKNKKKASATAEEIVSGDGFSVLKNYFITLPLVTILLIASGLAVKERDALFEFVSKKVYPDGNSSAIKSLLTSGVRKLVGGAKNLAEPDEIVIKRSDRYLKFVDNSLTPLDLETLIPVKSRIEQRAQELVSSNRQAYSDYALKFREIPRYEDYYSFSSNISEELDQLLGHERVQNTNYLVLAFKSFCENFKLQKRLDNPNVYSRTKTVQVQENQGDPGQEPLYVSVDIKLSASQQYFGAVLTSFTDFNAKEYISGFNNFDRRRLLNYNTSLINLIGHIIRDTSTLIDLVDAKVNADSYADIYLDRSIETLTRKLMSLPGVHDQSGMQQEPLGPAGPLAPFKVQGLSAAQILSSSQDNRIAQESLKSAIQSVEPGFQTDNTSIPELASYLNGSVKNLISHTQDLESRVKELESRLTACSEQTRTCSETLNNRIQELGIKDEKLSALGQQLENEARQVESMRTYIAGRETELNAQNSQVAALEEQRRLLDDRVRGLEAQLGSANDSNRQEIQRLLEQVEQERATCIEDNAGLKAVIVGTETKLNEQNRRVAGLREERDRLASYVKQLDDRIKELEGQVSACASELQTSRQNLDSSKTYSDAELGNLRAQLNQLRQVEQELEACRSERSAIQSTELFIDSDRLRKQKYSKTQK